MSADFKALIESAIEAEVRSRLCTFLLEYQTVEFGRPRHLTLEEQTLVINCIDLFLMRTSWTNLGVVQIQSLTNRLSHLASTAQVPTLPRQIRNACFDAIACIKALEARLKGTLIRSEVYTISMRKGSAANDA